MATTDAIAAVSDAVAALLDRASGDEDGGFELSAVEHTSATKLQEPPIGDSVPPTLTLWLHRVEVSPIRRHLTPRRNAAGDVVAEPVGLDLHYLLTAWASDPLPEQQALGWAIRVLEDHPVLPASLLATGAWQDVFREDETVELTWAPLSAQEESDLWQVAQTSQRPSASYLVRMVGIESARPLRQHAPVTTRRFDLEPA